MKKFIYFFLIIAPLISCKEEEKSEDANILSYSVTASSSPLLNMPKIIFNEENKIISLFSADDLPDDIFPVSLTPEMAISNHATINPESGTEITFPDKDSYILYTVTAENGTEVNWYVLLKDNQLPDAGFDDWFEALGLNNQVFMQPGRSLETTIWATANIGTSIYGVYCTNPLIDGTNTLAEIITGETSTVPLTAGTLFTGKFDVAGAINNPTNPEEATDFGIPFIYRPVALRFEYSYQAGDDYIMGILNDPNDIFGGFTVNHLEGNDCCKIYSYLESRNDDLIITIAQFEYISGNTQNDLTEVTIPYTYFSESQPTHLSLVFTSSKDGHLYTGSVDSRLIIDNLGFIYE